MGLLDTIRWVGAKDTTVVRDLPPALEKRRRCGARGVVVLLAFTVAPALCPSFAATDGRKLASSPNRYGAIAQHRASRSWGVSHDFARQRDASLEALKQCGHRKCEIIHKFKNGCAALADGPDRSFIASGVTRDEAETKALKRCARESCAVLAWACTR